MEALIVLTKVPSLRSKTVQDMVCGLNVVKAGISFTASLADHSVALTPKPTTSAFIRSKYIIMKSSQILSALLTVMRDWFPVEALKIEPTNRHHLLDTAFINDEIDLDQLAEELAQALSVRAD